MRALIPVALSALMLTACASSTPRSVAIQCPSPPKPDPTYMVKCPANLPKLTTGDDLDVMNTFQEVSGIYYICAKRHNDWVDSENGDK